MAAALDAFSHYVEVERTASTRIATVIAPA